MSHQFNQRIWLVVVWMFIFFVVPNITLALEHFEVNSSKSQITFLAKSTLHDVHGEVNEVEGYIDVENLSRMVDVQGKVSVPIFSMDTKNRKRDRNMKLMLHEKDFPKIVYEIELLEVDELVLGQESVGHIKGKLIIAGVAHVLATNVSVLVNAEEISIKGKINISLKEYNLRPPSVLGLIKVSDNVDVDFLVKLEK